METGNIKLSKIKATTMRREAETVPKVPGAQIQLTQEEMLSMYY